MPFHLSDIGEGIKEVTIKEWFVKVGDHVNQFDQICEVQSDKASVTISSRFDGVVAKLYYGVDDIAQTGDPLVDIEVVSGEGPEAEGSAGGADVQETEAIQIAASAASSSSGGGSSGKALATPAVRRMAAQHNINLNSVQGTGKDGRVLKEDVINFIESGGLEQQAPVVSKPPTPSAPPTPATPTSPKPKQRPAPPPPMMESDRTEKFSPMARAMSKMMTAALQIPHFGYKDEVDMSALAKLRNQLKHQEHKVKISYMPFMVKAASMALREHPILNASIDPEAEMVTYRANHNIGVAMDTPGGLLVPSIKRVQDLTLMEVAEELVRLQELGIKGKLGEADLKGSTFSISNIGSIGGTYAFPVIAPPAVAIGAVGKIRQLPRFDYEGNVIRAHIMNVSWSADHRIIDGATVARFSNRWKGYLENPASMLIDLK